MVGRWTRPLYGEGPGHRVLRDLAFLRDAQRAVDPQMVWQNDGSLYYMTREGLKRHVK